MTKKSKKFINIIIGMFIFHSFAGGIIGYNIINDYSMIFLLIDALILLSSSIVIAVMRYSVKEQLLSTFALSWGLMLSMSVGIFLVKDNIRIPIDWQSFLPLFIIIPVLIQITALLVYYIAILINKRKYPNIKLR